MKFIPRDDLEDINSIQILRTATQTLDTVCESSSEESANASNLSASFDDITGKTTTLIVRP